MNRHTFTCILAYALHVAVCQTADLCKPHSCGYRTKRSSAVPLAGVEEDLRLVALSGLSPLSALRPLELSFALGSFAPCTTVDNLHVSDVHPSVNNHIAAHI